MAKRSRVPAHKSLPEGQTNRNKNPKLSPYQRELKRNRLANQAPHVVHQKGGGRGAAGLRDEPAKARDLIKYLNAKNEYEAEKVRVKANRSHAIRQAKRDAAKALDGDAEESDEVADVEGEDVDAVAEEDSDAAKASDAGEGSEDGDDEAVEESDEEMNSDNVEGIEVAGGVVGSVVVLTPAQKRVVEIKTIKKLKKSSNNHLKALMTKKERVTYFGVNKGDDEAEKGPATAAVSAADAEEAEAKRQELLAVLVRRSGVLDTALDNERERLTKLVVAAERKHAKKLRNGAEDDDDEGILMTAPTKGAATAVPVGGYKKRKKGEDEDEGGPVQASVCDVNQEMLVEAGMAREKKIREVGDDSDVSSDSSSEIDTREMHHSGIYDEHTTALMKRKERKHLKKMEKRRDKRADQLADIEREVHQLTSKTHKKKMRKEARGTDEEKYEANLYRMQAEERRIGGKRERDEGQQGEESQKAVKRLSGLGDEEMSMREAIEEMRGGSGKNRVSGIRFGERVDAPPTFDSVPSMDVKTSLNKLATKLAAPQPPANKNASQKPTTNLGRTAKNSLGVPRDYVQGSASMGLQEKKRLAKLGLRGRVNEAHGHQEGGDGGGAPSHSNGGGKSGGASTSEFEAMRSKVMENYAASKRRAHEQMLAAKKEAGPKHKKRSNIANFVVSGGGEDEGYGSMGGGKFTDGKKFF